MPIECSSYQILRSSVLISSEVSSSDGESPSLSFSDLSAPCDNSICTTFGCSQLTAEKNITILNSMHGPWG